MSLLARLRDLAADPEPEPAEPDPSPSSSGACSKCAPAAFDRGPRWRGHVAARGRTVPADNGLRSI